jgi:hypothetical protein
VVPSSFKRVEGPVTAASADFCYKCSRGCYRRLLVQKERWIHGYYEEEKHILVIVQIVSANGAFLR